MRSVFLYFVNMILLTPAAICAYNSHYVLAMLIALAVVLSKLEMYCIEIQAQLRTNTNEEEDYP